jgi:hypothetical protein
VASVIVDWVPLQFKKGGGDLNVNQITGHPQRAADWFYLVPLEECNDRFFPDPYQLSKNDKLPLIQELLHNLYTVEPGYIAARYTAESDITRAISCLPNIS